MEAFEYAISKDVRNNPIVREVDEARQRELWKSVGIAVLLVLVLLLSAWQHFELLRHGYKVEEMQRERTAQEDISRQLRLEIETLRSPKRIETLATAAAPSGGALPGRSDCDRTRRAGRSADQIGGRTPVRPWRFQRRESTGATRFDWIRRVWRRPGARLAGPRETPRDWRDVLGVAFSSSPASWRSGSSRSKSVSGTCRSSTTPISSHVPNASRCIPAQRRPSAVTSSTVTAASWRRASTRTRSTRCPPRSDNAEDTAAKLCHALGDCTEKERQIAGRPVEPIARLCLRPAPGLAGRRAPGRRSQSRGRRASSRRAGASTRTGSSPRTWSATSGVDNIGLDGIEVAYDSQIRGKPGTVLIQTDARRHAFSRFEQPPTSGSTIELTIDQYLQHVAERELHAGRRREPRRGRQRHHHESAHGRDSRDGERADVQPERLSRVRGCGTPESRGSGSVRAGIDVQGRDRVGGDRREGDADRHADRHQPRRAPHRRTPEAGHRVRAPRLRRAVVHRRASCDRATSARSRSASASAPSG